MEKLRIELEKTKCKNCGKKVEILEVTGGGSKIKSAPCKNCTCENLISEEKWDRGPAEVDLVNDREIIQYIRDLFNLGSLLENGVDAELLPFIRKLRKAGYTDSRVHQFITYAGSNTRFEYLTDFYGKKLVPMPIPEQGDQKEWAKKK